MNDLLDVNESEANISSTNYTLYLTKKEIEELERIRQRNEYVFEKQKNARSSIIKKIVENTYLYLNNNERCFMNDLEKIITELESGNIDLEESISKYTEAMQLVKECDEKLNSAQEAIAKIVNDNKEVVEFEINE